MPHSQPLEVCRPVRPLLARDRVLCDLRLLLPQLTEVVQRLGVEELELVLEYSARTQSLWHHFQLIATADGAEGEFFVVPAFNASGVLPPFVGADPGMDSDLASPYSTTMSGFINQFGKSAPRRNILRRLLEYRQLLRDIGITTGFQMFDGSFIEDCERLRSRPPSDLDVVSFSHLPVPPHQVAEFVQQNIGLFDPIAVKQTYLLDAFFVDLTRDARYVVAETMYWYGLFSHQRDTFMWKGLVTVPLISDDTVALASLEAAEAANAQEA